MAEFPAMKIRSSMMNSITMPRDAEVSLSLRAQSLADMQRHHARGEPSTLTLMLTGTTVGRMDLHCAGDPDSCVRVTVDEEELIRQVRLCGYHVVKETPGDLISGEELVRQGVSVQSLALGGESFVEGVATETFGHSDPGDEIDID